MQRIRACATAFVLIVVTACVDRAPVDPGRDTPDADRVRQLPTRTYVADTTTDFPNPERGFYIQRTAWYPEQPSWVYIDAADFRRARDSGMSVVRVYVVMTDHRDRPLTSPLLQAITNVFTTARTAGVKVIPRLAYNFGNAPDAPLAVVLQHIDQLGPVFRANADVIAFIEGGFIGYWGEWHTSTNGLIGPWPRVNDGTRAILERELAAFPPERPIALRYAFNKRELLGEAPLDPGEAFTGTPRARVGAHNDCFLASRSNWGTYLSPDDAGLAREKQWLRDDNRFVPQGGETCNDAADAQPYIGCTNALQELDFLRFSVLNADYHPGVNARWRNEGCMPEVRRRLGYRFRLVRAGLSREVTVGGTLRLAWTIRNDGFATPYTARTPQLVLREPTTGAEVRLPLARDPRRWLPGSDWAMVDTLVLPADLAPGRYAAALAFPDATPSIADRPEYAIRLANVGVWDASRGVNDLGLTVDVR
ncbi:MAG: DUF4832 domain-containing protein [Gemmatimonadaceae bacterium]|nr:DUF4832 domain-containing protein [Gemmatimonadaceae bacterium]